MVVDSGLVARYVRYRAARAKIKVRQREELERELEPLAADLGAAIVAERETGLRVEDIGALLGLKNRTFIYKMIEVHKLKNVPVDLPDTQPAPPVADYVIVYDNHDAVVTVFGKTYTITNAVLPDEWAEGSKEERAVYARIIREINAAT